MTALLSEAALDALLDPARSVGHAPALVDRALGRRVAREQEVVQ